MNLATAMKDYATSDKEKFPSFDQEWNEKRVDTTFYADFSVADAYGIDAIKDTYKRAFDSWKSDYRYFTELVGALNHKLWYWYEKEGQESQKARLYNDLWTKADVWAYTHLKEEEYAFYHWVLD